MADVDSMRLESLPDAAQQSTDGLTGSVDMVPATPSTPPEAFTIVSEEMREHIQVSIVRLQCFYMQSCLPASGEPLAQTARLSWYLPAWYHY